MDSLRHGAVEADRVAADTADAAPAATPSADVSTAYRVEIAGAFQPALDTWRAMAETGAALPFQGAAWLEAWDVTLGRQPDVEMIAATVYDAEQRPVMGLPLMRRHKGAQRAITFADCGVVDYNAPILSPLAPLDRVGAQRVWQALRRALPRADLVRLEKMPHRIGPRRNPLALLAEARPSRNRGLSLDMPGSYADWRQAFPRRYRMELGRCARLFDALPGAAFGRIEGAEVPRVFAALESLQRARIAALGLPYALDDGAVRGLYRRLVEPDGPGLLTALTVDGTVVAVLLGLRQGAHYVMLRIAAHPDYAQMSPARDVIVRTVELLRPAGVETFDFGLGDYPYKRKLGGSEVELCDLVVARSPLGAALLAGERFKGAVRANPRLRALAERLGLKPAEAGEREG